MKKIIIIGLALLALSACNDGKKQNKQTKTKSAEISTEDQTFKTAVEAYIWAYPMVSIGVTCALVTNVPKPLPNAHAPINSFGSVSKLYTAANKDVVSSNVDNMYSSAFLDLTQGAAKISVPATNGRYYSLQLLDAYSNDFDYIGSRATGTDVGIYLIVGPDWNGETPEDVLKVFKSPTNLVWVIGRTLVDGQEDVVNVRKIQEQYKITVIPPATSSPTSWSVRNNFPALEKKPPVDNVNGMDWKTYFTWVGKLMMENPVPASHQAYVDGFKSIGLSFEHGFDFSSLTPEQQKGIERAVIEGLKQLDDAAKKKTGTIHEGWFYSLKAGVWGDDYMYRGAIAYRSLGQNIPAEAVYMNTTEDKEGNLLDASKNNYQITFAKGQLHPVDAFWSFTMYNDENFFVPNPINRLAIGNRSKSMEPNADGSLTVYFQKDAPKGKEGNWLPAPDGKFRVSLRLYIPKENVINGSWLPPGIEKMN
jgi:hypothetical protein